MTPAEKIARIQQGLAKRREPTSHYYIAGLLGVSPSTVSRWVAGATPRGRQAEALEVLYRTVVKADEGNEGAQKILGAVLGGIGASLLGIGLGGALIAAGFGWLVGEHFEEEERKRNGDHHGR